MKLISIVVALYNEEGNIPTLIQQISLALQDHNYEVILVDDGSTDASVKIIKENLLPGIKLIVLRKNYGQSAAMAAGIDAAKGDYIVTMDADLQNDPSDIPIMLEKLRAENWELVAGIRTNRKDTRIRKIPSRIANKLIRTTTGVTLHDYGCTLKIFRREIAKNLELY